MNEAETVTLSMKTLSGEPGPISVIPRKIGSVRLIREVGKGGMGVVWLGRDDFLGRDIAVKFLLSAIQSQEDPGFVTFLEGARAAAAVHAPGLLTVYAADVIDAVPYIVMEFVDGPTVSRLTRLTGPLSLPSALGVLEPVCSAIAALHDHGIIHRDIKPANLLLDRDARVFVTDFGLACPRPTGMVGKVAEGVAGTPHYMAPEMFEGNVSVRTDVYALGVATYELLTGEVPFSGTLEIIREGHQKNPLPMEMLTERQVPPAVVEVIERATHKNFLFRYKTARHYLNALHEAVPEAQTWSRGQAQLVSLVAKCLQSALDADAAARAESEDSADRGGRAIGKLAGAIEPKSSSPPHTASAPSPAVGSSYYDLLATRAGVKRLEDTLDLAAEAAAGVDGAGSGAGELDGPNLTPPARSASWMGGSGSDPSASPALDPETGLVRAAPMPTLGPSFQENRSDAWSWPSVFGACAVLLAMFSGIYQLGVMAITLVQTSKIRSTAPAGGGSVWDLMSAAVGLLLAGLLLVSGVGILRRREWGVAGMFVWSGLALLPALIGLCVAMWLNGWGGGGGSALLSLAESLSPQSSEIARRIAALLVISATLWRLGWPLAAILWLRRARSRADIAAWEVAAET